MVEKLLDVFSKKNWKMNNLEYKKYLKEKVMNCMSNGQDLIIHLIVVLIKKTFYKNDSALS